MTALNEFGIPAAQNYATIRGIDTQPAPQWIAVFAAGREVIADTGVGIFYWSPEAGDTDNDDTVLRPNDRSASAGRWLRLVGSDAPTPLTILGAKLKLWLDADLGVTPGATLIWADQSGTGNDVTQATGASQPTIVVGPNGHSAFDFDGTDDFFGGPALSAILSASAWTAWIVLNTDAIDTNNVTVYSNDAVIAEPAGFWGVHLRNDTPTAKVYSFDSGAGDIDSTTYAVGVYSVLRARHDGVNVYIKNGSAAESAGVAAGALAAGGLASAFRIGRGASGATSLNGKIAFIAMTNAVTDTTEHDAMTAYLTTRFAV